MTPEEIKFNDLISALNEAMGWKKSTIARIISVKPNTITENLDKKLIESKNHKASRRLIKLTYVVFCLKARGIENDLIKECLNYPTISSPIGPRDSIVSAIVLDREIDLELLAEYSNTALDHVIQGKQRIFEEMCSPIRKLMYE